MTWEDFYNNEVTLTFGAGAVGGQVVSEIISVAFANTGPAGAAGTDSILNITPSGCYKIHSIYLDADKKIVVKYTSTPEA